MSWLSWTARVRCGGWRACRAIAARRRVPIPILVCAALCAGLVLPRSAAAQTLRQTLAQAYAFSPDLNAARGTLRATDEGVAIAKSLSRPQLGLTGSAAYQVQSYAINTPIDLKQVFSARPATVGVTLVQPLFTGFQTEARLKYAESSVKAQRALTVDAEQTALNNAGTAFVDIILFTDIVTLFEQDLQFLRDEVSQTDDRLKHHDATMTELEQAKAQLQAATGNLATYKANLATVRARFVQYTGIEPKTLDDSQSFDALVPKSLAQATDIAMRDQPALRAAVFNIDVAKANLAYVEGALLPQVSAQASNSLNTQTSGIGRYTQPTVTLNAAVPVYQGGGEYAQIRQQKEQVKAAAIQADSVREQLRDILAAQWATYQSTSTAIAAINSQILSAQVALAGTKEQLRLGEVTTLDVLNAQNLLLNARLSLAQSRQQRALALFGILQAIGHFDASHLGLDVKQVNPDTHLNAVKDLWVGLRAPDGR